MVGDSMCYDDRQHKNKTPAKRTQFAVKTSVDNAEDWSVDLGDFGYNYGKNAVQLGDGSLLIVGITNTEADNHLHRSVTRLDVNTGDVLSLTVLPHIEDLDGGLDGWNGVDLCSCDESGMSVWVSGFVDGDRVVLG